KVVVASYNCMKWLPRCLESIASQDYLNYDVWVTDDGSDGDQQASYIEKFCKGLGWGYNINEKNTGALYSQVHAIRSLNPEAGDVVVYVDGDDRLAHDRVFDVLNRHYKSGVLMTYGGYTTDPPDPRCPKPKRYPKECEESNDYRRAHHWGILFNHLRTH